ncbi:MAG: hypothetical protein RBU30_24705 [Polyangia bacterium]|jgi:hypothetical protein|nr:hypothetical protein [Polyangia bacterium]
MKKQLVVSLTRRGFLAGGLAGMAAAALSLRAARPRGRKSHAVVAARRREEGRPPRLADPSHRWREVVVPPSAVGPSDPLLVG